MKTFGEISLHRGEKWVVECEPHVLLRLKRIFAGASRQTDGRLTLSNTPEICADLEWVLARYPMTVTPADVLATRAKDHHDRMSAIDAMLMRRVPPPEFDLAIPPREYQRIAAAIALETRGLLLADDLGLGKTASAICMFTDPRTLPALVVTMTHLVPQWVAEIGRFAPKLKVHTLKKATPYDLTAGRARAGQMQLGLPSKFPDVVVTNYHKIHGWAGTFAPSKSEPLIRSVVFDEAQELRHDDSQKYHAATVIGRAAQFRLATTATPVFNYGLEFFNIVQVIKHGALGTKGEFQTEWCTGDERKIAKPKAFGTYVRESGIMLRRTRAEVGRELPALTRIPHTIESDAGALAKVDGAAVELARIILAQSGAGLAKMQASAELDVMVRRATGVGKALFVAEFVRLLLETEKKILLFGWHHDVYALWRERLADLNPVFFTGRESANEKEATKRAFVEGDSRLMVMSLRAGAGLDGLQKVCRTCVFGELDWSPAVHDQGIGRLHRDGQTDPVMAYFLLADSGSDPIVADILGIKRGQIEGINDPDADLIEKLEIDPDHIKKLAATFISRRSVETQETTAA